MKKIFFAGLLSAVLLVAANTIPAMAGCGESGKCGSQTNQFKKQSTVKKPSTFKKHSTRSVSAHSRKAKYRPASGRKHVTARRQKVRGAVAGPAHFGHVVAMIKSMAPQQGVPAWFALRIAQVESNYNPRLRGQAGEYGVFQIKCATAKGIGFRGNCSALLDPHTNVRFGIKHLALAMKSSRGNLKLAASKHNGGLGRKTVVHGYVAKVF